MASVLKLKTDIKNLKAAIASKATSGAIKTKLRGKLSSLENELDKLQPNKRKPKTTGPKSESALVKLAKKRRTNQGLSTSKSDIERDAIRPAKKAGKRISASGNTYYEYRDNRVDNRQPPRKYRKLADGGKVIGYTMYYEPQKNLGGKSVQSDADIRVNYKLMDAVLDKKLGDNYLGGTFYIGDGYGKIALENDSKKNEVKSILEIYDFEDATKMYSKEKGGYMADGGNLSDAKVIAKLQKKFANKNLDEDFDYDEDDNFKVDGYNVEIFDWKEEDEMNDYIKKYSKDNYLVPYSSDDDNYYLIVVPKDKMDHGGYMADGGSLDYKLDVINQYSDEKLARIYSQMNDLDYSEILSEIKGDPEERKEIAFKIFKEVVERDNEMSNGGMMADGGSVAKGNYEMLMSQAKEVMHHAEELMQVVKPNMDIEAWVVSKAERATTDLSDITHYLDGLKMAMGGMVKHNAHKVNG
jgi:hypothetical protein